MNQYINLLYQYRNDYDIDEEDSKWGGLIFIILTVILPLTLIIILSKIEHIGESNKEDQLRAKLGCQYYEAVGKVNSTDSCVENGAGGG